MSSWTDEYIMITFTNNMNMQKNLKEHVESQAKEDTECYNTFGLQSVCQPMLPLLCQSQNFPKWNFT